MFELTEVEKTWGCIRDEDDPDAGPRFFLIGWKLHYVDGSSGTRYGYVAINKRTQTFRNYSYEHLQRGEQPKSHPIRNMELVLSRVVCDAILPTVRELLETAADRRRKQHEKTKYKKALKSKSR